MAFRINSALAAASVPPTVLITVIYSSTDRVFSLLPQISQFYEMDFFQRATVAQVVEQINCFIGIRLVLHKHAVHFN